MPHVTKSSKRVSELHPGDLVWAKISGFPAWPGQILPDDKATPKQLRSKKPGSLFVAFFGDSSHAWNLPGELDRFEDEYDRNKAQSCIKNREKTFITAVEEAKEVWDKRNGRRPATNHGAFDFLDCSTWPEHWLGTSEEVPVKAHWIPEAPSHTQLRAISTASAIQWLRRLAASPLSVLDNNFGIKRDHGPTISLIWSLGDSRCLKLDPATGQLLPTEAPSSTTADDEKSAPRYLKKKLIEKVSTVSDPVQMKGEDGCKNDSDGTKKARPAVKLTQENKIQKCPDSEEASTPNAKKRAKVGDASAAAAPAAPASVVKVLDRVTEEDITADLAALRAGGDSSLLNLAMFGGEIPGMLAPKDVMDACKQLAGDPIHWAAAIASEDSKTFENKGEKVQKLLAASAAYFRYRELRYKATGYYLPPRGEIGHVARAALEEVGAIPEAYGVESRKKITDLIARLNQQKSEETHMPSGIRDVADEVPPMVHGSGAGIGGGEQNNVLKKARRKSAASESRKNALKVLQESRSDILVDSGVKVGSSERRCKPKLVGNEDNRKTDILLEADELSDISEPDDGPSSSSERLPEEQDQEVERFSRQGANSANGQHKPAAMSYIKKYDYIHLPALASKESFLTAYQKFYGNSGREMPTDSSIHAFEPYEVFCAVAKEGGYEAVTESHGWRKLTCSWRPSMAANKQCGQDMRKAYKILLLPFQKFLTDSLQPLLVEQVLSKHKAHITSKQHKQASNLQDLKQAKRPGSISKDKTYLADFDNLAEKEEPKRPWLDPKAVSGSYLQPGQAKFLQQQKQGLVGGRTNSSVGGQGERGPREEDSVRVLIRYPEGTMLPKHEEVLSSLKRYGALDKSSVGSNSPKSILWIDFRDHKTAKEAFLYLRSAAHHVFPSLQLDRNAKILVRLVRTNDYGGNLTFSIPTTAPQRVSGAPLNHRSLNPTTLAAAKQPGPYPTLQPQSGMVTPAPLSLAQSVTSAAPADPRRSLPMAQQAASQQLPPPPPRYLQAHVQEQQAGVVLPSWTPQQQQLPPVTQHPPAILTVTGPSPQSYPSSSSGVPQLPPVLIVPPTNTTEYQGAPFLTLGSTGVVPTTRDEAYISTVGAPTHNVHIPQDLANLLTRLINAPEPVSDQAVSQAGPFELRVAGGEAFPTSEMDVVSGLQQQQQQAPQGLSQPPAEESLLLDINALVDLLSQAKG